MALDHSSTDLDGIPGGSPWRTEAMTGNTCLVVRSSSRADRRSFRERKKAYGLELGGKDWLKLRKTRDCLL